MKNGAEDESQEGRKRQDADEDDEARRPSMHEDSDNEMTNGFKLGEESEAE